MSRGREWRASANAVGALCALFVVGACALGLVFTKGGESLARARDVLSQTNERDQVQATEHFKSALVALATTPSLKEAFLALESGYDAHIPEHLRDMYVALNPHQGDDLSALSDPRDGSLYSGAHAKHHVWLREFARSQGFSDVFFAKPDGQIIYSVRKGRTFATRVTERDDDLALREFSRIIQAFAAPEAGRVELSSAVPSLLGAREIFGGTAILDEAGKKRGVLVVSRPARAPVVLSTGDSFRAIVEAYEGRALTVGVGFFGFFVLMLGGLVLLPARRSSQESDVGLALIPVEEGARTSESGSSGSYRSGTRPVASPLHEAANLKLSAGAQTKRV